MATFTVLENNRTLLRIDGAFVAAYDSPEQAEVALNAYRGNR